VLPFVLHDAEKVHHGRQNQYVLGKIETRTNPLFMWNVRIFKGFHYSYGMGSSPIISIFSNLSMASSAIVLF